MDTGLRHLISPVFIGEYPVNTGLFFVFMRFCGYTEKSRKTVSVFLGWYRVGNKDLSAVGNNNLLTLGAII